GVEAGGGGGEWGHWEGGGEGRGGGGGVGLAGKPVKTRAPAVKKTADLAFGHCRERLLDFILVAAVQNQDGLSDRLGGCFHLAEHHRRRWRLRTDEKGDRTGLREDFPQQFQALRNCLGLEGVDSRRVAGWPVEAGDEARLHRVKADGKDDRDGCGRLLRRHCLGAPVTISKAAGSPSSSAARDGRRSRLPSPNRYSIATSRPTTKPAC